MTALEIAPVASSGWNPDKVAAYEEAYEAFTSQVRFDSKETGGGTVLAQNRYESQRWFLRAIWDGLARDIHDFKILKSRQLGCTTEGRALGVFWLGIHDGMRGAMVFDTDAHKEEARLEIEMMITNLPKSVRFPKIVPPSNRYLMTLSNGSLIRFMAAGTRVSKSSGVLGRSSGINLLLASEMCSWNNPEGIVSLKQSLAEIYENRLFIWESTGRGFNDWHDMWEEARADELSQSATFLGWWLKDTQRIERGSAMWEAYGAPEVTPQEAKRIEAVKEQYGYEISREQLAWYRRKMDPTREREDDDPEDGNQIQEQPFTESECFIATGSTFFDALRLSDRMAQAVQYRHQSYKFWPGSDFFSSRIDLARTWRETQLKLWEEPLTDAVYVVAADPAFGHDEDNDRSAINVLRCYADCVEQVAEFASASTPTHQFAWLILSLAAYYGLYAGTSVLMIIELNGPGEAVWREIMQLRGAIVSGYYREAARERGIGDMINNIRQYIYSRSDAMTAGHSYHWKTTSQLKVAIMERLRDYVHNGKLLVRSQDTLEEMRSITRDGDTIKAEGRKHDDRAFTLALGIRAYEERQQRALMAGGRTKAADQAKRALSIADQYQLFRQYQLDSFFKQKTAARVGMQRAQQRRNWGRRF
jgi:hypothetical protein